MNKAGTKEQHVGVSFPGKKRNMGHAPCGFSSNKIPEAPPIFGQPENFPGNIQEQCPPFVSGRKGILCFLIAER